MDLCFRRIEMNKVIFLINRIVLGLLWVLLAYESLFPIEVLELELYARLPINWYITPLFARFFIASIAILGFFIWIGCKHTWVRIYSLFLIFAVLLDYFLVQTPSKYDGFFKTPWMEAYVYMALLLAGTILLYTEIWKNISFKVPYPKIKYLWPVWIILVFILNPVFPEDFKEGSAPSQDGANRWNMLQQRFPYLKQNSTPHLYAFFSVTCGFCKVASRKLQEGLHKNKNHVPVTIIFWGNDTLVQRFANQTHTELNHVRVEDESYPKIAGARYPAYLYIDQTNQAWFYTGSNFNYYAFQKMHTHE